MGKPVMEGPVGGGAERGLAGRQPPPSGRLPAWPRLRGAAAAGTRTHRTPAGAQPHSSHAKLTRGRWAVPDSALAGRILTLGGNYRRESGLLAVSSAWPCRGSAYGKRRHGEAATAQGPRLVIQRAGL